MWFRPRFYVMSDEYLTTTFTSLRQRLSAVAKRIVGSDDDADDVLQDAFCRLWSRRESFDTQSHADGAAILTVKNLSIDVVRSRSRRPQVDIDGVDLPDDADDADRGDLLKEVGTIVDSELTDQQREILRLREIEGLSNEMIADRLDMNEVTVRVNLSRARKKIRDIYNNKQPR